MSGSGGVTGPKRKRDTYGGPNNKRAIMSAMHSMTSVNLPPGIENGTTINGYPRKNNKSNNRREWMKECLKLLEAMMELEDSKPFREPVDCLKYPEFYTLVGDPIDLSKVMLKFRGGQYQDPFDFEKDVKQLFDDYKAFFKDPKTEIYVQTQNLCLWFELEFRRILDKYGDKLKRRPEVVPPVVMTTDASANTTPTPNANIMVSINNGSCTILQSPERQVQAPISDSLQPTAHWSQVMQNKNFRLVQQQVISQPPTLTSVGHRPNSPYYSNNNNITTSHAIQPIKEFLPFNSTYTPENTPPHNRWQADLQHQPQTMPMVTNSPKQLESRNSTELGLTRILNGCDLTPPHHSMGSLRDNSPEFIHSHHLSAERLYQSRLSFATDRSFSQHSDPGTYHRRDRSFDLHSPNSYSPQLHNSPQPSHPMIEECSPPVISIQHPTSQTPMEASSSCSSTTSNKNSSAAMHANAHVGTTLVGMKLDVSNIFFGKVRCKPAQPVIVHENGFKIPVIHKDTGTTITFKIKVDEIVRISAHLGRNKKHTLFIFVTPSFIQNLEDSLSEHDSKASLIAFFMPALSVSQVGRLLHVFHNMSKHSMFGNLFSEIDQKGALSLLANIKPGIIDRVAEKERSKDSSGSTNSSTSMLMVPTSHRNPMGRSSSLPTSSSPPPSNNSARGGSVEKEVNREQGTALDLTLPLPRPASEQQLQQMPQNGSNLLQVAPTSYRAYKPKFHFRSHSSHGSLMKQGSTNSEPGISLTGSRSLDIEIGPANSPASSCKDQDMDCSNSVGGGGGSTSQLAGKPPLFRDASGSSRDEPIGSDRTSKKNICLVIDSDLELDYEPDEEELSSSQHSLLLFNDSSGEDLTIVDPEEDDTLSAVKDTMVQESDLVMTEQKVSLRCPITQQVMKYPLRNRFCGHCYDKEGVIQLIKNRANKARCAFGGCRNDRPLLMKDLIFESDLYNQVLKKLGHFQVK